MTAETAAVISIDAALLADVLERVEDLAEAKVVWHVVRRAAERESPAVPLNDLLASAVARTIAPPTSPEPGPDRVRQAIERALANGFLLRLSLADEGDGPRVFLLPATAANRDLIERFRLGDPAAERMLALPPARDVSLYRANLFALYERHIGPLTPLIAEQLRDAESAYPRAWIEQAIQAAVDYNKRNWRYIQTILRRWEEEGFPDGITR